jgi:hypothetical protein
MSVGRRVQMTLRYCGAVVTMLAALLFAPGAGLANHDPSASPSPKHDFAVGGGQFLLTPQNFGFAAQSGPNGEDARGHHTTRYTVLDDTFAGDVTCLTVTGNTAVYGGVVTNAGIIFAPEGSGFLIEVIDNGEPVNGQPVDLIGGIAGPSAGLVLPPTQCPAHLPAFATPPFLTESGNITVHDAP